MNHRVNVDFGCNQSCYTADLGSGFEAEFCGSNHSATFIFQCVILHAAESNNDTVEIKVLIKQSTCQTVLSLITCT